MATVLLKYSIVHACTMTLYIVTIIITFVLQIQSKSTPLNEQDTHCAVNHGMGYNIISASRPCQFETVHCLMAL